MHRVHGRRVVLAVAVVMVATVLGGCQPAPGPGGGNSTGLFQFDPAATDPRIQSEPLFPSFSYNPAGVPRGKLVVLFNGTGAGPLALARMGQVLAADGYHVIGLRYRSDVGTLAACPDSQRATNPECHRQFRGEIVHGVGVPDPDGASFNHPSVNVAAPNSVVSRLIHHVEYLHARFPTFDWGRFQQRAGGDCTRTSAAYGGCELRWEHIVAMGHSQGAGVALYLGRHYPLDRVAMLSGAYDAFGDGSGGYVPAPWVDEGRFAVPVGAIATFSHTGDPAIGIHRAVADAVGIPGPEVSTSQTPRPFNSRARLVTSAQPACPFDTAQTHNSTATDLCAPAGAHDDVWRYLASGN